MRRARSELRNSSFRTPLRIRRKRRRIAMLGSHPTEIMRPVFQRTPRGRLVMLVPPPGPLTLRETMRRTGSKTRKALAKSCRAGRFPRPRFDRWSGTPYWLRLEFESHAYWLRCHRARRPKINRPTEAQGLSRLLGVPVIQRR